MSDYHINLFYSDEDGGYIADIPDLDSCSAFGSSPERALAEVEIAKDAWLSAARQDGRLVPEPRYRPAIYAR
jgi:predicted RNase H-like HicB family nuclease